jgi:hypothetical protein
MDLEAVSDLNHPHGVKTMRWPAILILAALAGIPSITRAQDSTVVVGPWTIAVSSKADKFDSCTMSRSINDLGATFVRAQDGLVLVLDSPKWRLDRGKGYDVILTAGARSVQAKASAESKSVTISLSDRALNESIRSANVLKVKGEGTTLAVPLDGTTPALGRLESCFERNSRASVETNPFVPLSRKP